MCSAWLTTICGGLQDTVLGTLFTDEGRQCNAYQALPQGGLLGDPLGLFLPRGFPSFPGALQFLLADHWAWVG